MSLAQFDDRESEDRIDRTFSRVAVDLLGRFMREDRSEYPCRAQDMSPGDVVILSPVAVEIDEQIIAYLDHLGRVEGSVVRVFEGGFAISYSSSERKREKIAAQLTWLANRHELDLPEDRRHERVEPENPFVQAILQDGRSYQVRIIDLSLSGAAVKSSIRPAIGSAITLGSTGGRVVRHLDEGFAIEFSRQRQPTPGRTAIDPQSL